MHVPGTELETGTGPLPQRACLLGREVDPQTDTKPVVSAVMERRTECLWNTDERCPTSALWVPKTTLSFSDLLEGLTEFKMLLNSQLCFITITG